MHYATPGDLKWMDDLAGKIRRSHELFFGDPRALKLMAHALVSSVDDYHELEFVTRGLQHADTAIGLAAAKR